MVEIFLYLLDTRHINVAPPEFGMLGFVSEMPQHAAGTTSEI
jgi:hypothetical protein